MVIDAVVMSYILAAAGFLIAAGWAVNRSKLRQQIALLESQSLEEESQKQALESELSLSQLSQARLDERIGQISLNVQELRDDAESSAQLIDQLRGELASERLQAGQLQTTLENERRSSAEKLALLDEAKNRLGNEFKVLANQIFEEKGKAFSEQNRSSIDEVLKPVREQLGEFRKRVDEVHHNDAKDRASLREHLSQLEKLNRQMSEDALSLTHALKGESKAQGNWGEMILERILETSGLREGREFIREQSFTTEEGRRLRPDVVVYMPGDKQVIVDAKVSLTDYERAVSADSDVARQAALSAHVRSLKEHIKTLANKRYDHLPGVNTPEYVLMFVPIEGAYLMAIEADQSVFEVAFDQRVAVVTPSTLYATLKLIEQLWRYERQNDDVLKLIDRAGKLHDKMAGFVESFTDIGERLGQAQKAYDTSLNRMTTGPGNVISQIDTLGKLAGKTKKELPKQLTEVASLEDQTGNDEPL